MTTLQSNPYADLMKPPDTPVSAPSNPYATLMQPEPTAVGYDPARALVQAMEAQPAPDRPWYANIGVGLARGFIDTFKMSGDLGQAVSHQARQLIGDSSALDALDNFSKAQSMGARIFNATALPMQDSLPGQIAEGVFPTVEAVGLAAAATLALPVTAPAAAVTATSIGMFGAISGAQSFAESFVRAKDANKSDDEALAEARAGGAIGTIVGAGTGAALFLKIPGANRFLTNSISKFATRMALAGGIGEASAVTQRVTTDAWVDALRNEPDTALKLYNSDPGYWGRVFKESLPSAISMGLAGAGAEAFNMLAEGRALKAEELVKAREDILRTLPAEKIVARDPDNLTVLKPSASDRINAPLTAEDFVAERIEPKDVAEAKATVDEMVKTKLDPESGAPLNEIEIARAQELQAELEKAASAPPPLEATPTEGQPAEVVQPSGESSAKNVKTRIREVVMGPKAMITMSEKSLLKLSMRQQAKGARIAESATKKALGEVRTRLLADARQKGKDELARVVGLKNELIKLTKEGFPGKEVPKSILTDIGSVTTFGGLSRAVRNVSRLVDEAEHAAAIDKLKSIIKSAKPEKMIGQFRNAFTQLTKNLDLTGLSSDKVAALVALAADKGEANLPNKVIAQLERLGKTKLADLDRPTAIRLANQLAEILQQSKEARKTARAAEKEALNQLRDGVMQELGNTIQMRSVDEGGNIAPVPNKGLLRTAFSAVANHTLDTLGESMGGDEGSLTHWMLYKAPWQARTNAIAGMYEIADNFRDFLKNQGLDPAGKEFSQWSALVDRSPDQIDTPVTGGSVKMTRAQRVYLLLSLMDHDFHDQVLFDNVPLHMSGAPKGANFELTFEDAQKFVNSASPQERAIADEIFKAYNGPLKDLLSSWSERNNHYDITSGKPYFTIHRVYEGQTPAKPTPSFRQFIAESSGLLKDRTGSRLPIEIRDAFGEFSNYTWQINGIAHIGPAIKTVRDLFLRGPGRQALANSKSVDALKFIDLAMSNLTREFTGGSVTPGFLEPAISGLMGRVGHALIGNNPDIALYHIAATSMLAGELGPGPVSLAIAEGAMFSSKVAEAMRKGSPALRLRADSSGIGMIFEGGGSRRQMMFMPKGSEPSMFMLNSVMEANARVAWRAAEIKAKQMGLSSNAAASLAESAINRTQITYDPLNRSGFAQETSLKPAVRLLTMFRAQTSKMLSQVMARAGRIARGQGSFTGNVAVIANIAVANAVMIAAVKKAERWITGADSGVKSEGSDWGARIIAHIANLIPFGQFIGAAVNRVAFPKSPAFAPDISPVASAMNDGVAAFTGLERNIANSDHAAKVVDNSLKAAEAASALAGVPAVWPIETLRQIIKSHQSKPVRMTGN